MASEADTRHGPLGILLAQARAEKITYLKSRLVSKPTSRVLRRQEPKSLAAKRRWVAG
jgi:hypothetical protein